MKNRGILFHPPWKNKFFRQNINLCCQGKQTTLEYEATIFGSCFSKCSQKITPLTIQVNGRHELVGVLMGSGRMSGKPSIYARVSDKLGWIKKHTKGIMDSKCNVLS